MSKEEPIYFWRETEHPHGFLSQWFTAPFTAPPCSHVKLAKHTLTFLTTEQYMMYHKALVFEDEDIAALILNEQSPKKQKALGRKVANFDGRIWDQVKEKIVEEGNFYKFSQTKLDAHQMRQSLLDTGDRLLVEASPYDRIWGVGYSASNAEANRQTWGSNSLGKILMVVRQRLQAESALLEADTNDRRNLAI